MIEKVLALEESDDITAIRSRIEFALPKITPQVVHGPNGAERAKLLIVVPSQNKALNSLVNMKLLARQFSYRAVELAIVTSHPTIRDYAKEAGLKTFSSLKSAKRAGWVTDENAITPPSETLPPPLKTAGRLPRNRVKKKRYAVVEGDAKRQPTIWVAQWLGRLALVLVLAVALVLGALLLFPQATVTVTPIAQPVETELIVKADPEADGVNFQELTFPARIDQVELAISDQIETVKTELAPTGRATGQVVFINRTEDSFFLPISTTVSTSAGEPVEFRTLQTITVPSGVGSTSSPVAVIAMETGPRGNVSPTQINRVVDGSYSLLARVVNEQATGGGSMEPARIVEESDKERLNAYLRQRIQQEGLERLKASLSEQEFIPPETVQVIVLDIKYREFSGDFSDTFGGEMQAVVRATVIGGYNANRLALAALDAQIPPGFELDLEGLQFGAGEVLNVDGQTATFKIFASGKAVPNINDREIAKDIVGMSIGEAQSMLEQQYPLATVPGVDLRPGWLVNWLGRLPFSSLRINVVINDAVTFVADGD